MGDHANLSSVLQSHLKVEEGFSASLYRDSRGFWTWGYGFLADPRRNPALPRAVADFWLQVLCNERIVDLLGALPWLAQQPPHVQLALADMAYQMGVDGVLEFHDMLAALQRGDLQGAVAAAEDSDWARETPARAKRVTALLGQTQ